MLSPLNFSQTQALLQQLVGVEMIRGAVVRLRRRHSSALAEPMAEGLDAARQQPLSYVGDGASSGNAAGSNPECKRGWQWVIVTAVVTVFVQGLSRSTAAVIELPGNAFGGIVVSDRILAYNHLPTMQRQLCWTHLFRVLTSIAERLVASAEFRAKLLLLQHQLFDHWHHYKEESIYLFVLQKTPR